MTVNQIAFCSATVFGAATIGAAVAAATTASTVATVAYAILAVGLAGAGMASVTAWLDPESTDASSYFGKMQKHAGVAIAGLIQLFATTAVSALAEGVGRGISNGISRKIGGEDHTIGVRHY